MKKKRKVKKIKKIIAPLNNEPVTRIIVWTFWF